MEQLYKYSVFTIDMKAISDLQSLCEEFLHGLGCADIDESDLSNIDKALRASIDKHINIIVYNFKVFRRRFKKEGKILSQIIFDYNQLEKSRSIMFDEYDEISKAKKPLRGELIWEREPSCWGYRGDPNLWKDMKSHNKDRQISFDEHIFISQIHQSFQGITGQSIFDSDAFYLNKYDQGGMSGGLINCNYWIEYLIPLLIGRYRKLIDIGLLNT